MPRKSTRDRAHIKHGEVYWKDQRDYAHGPRRFVSGNRKYQRRHAAEGKNRSMGRCNASI